MSPNSPPITPLSTSSAAVDAAAFVWADGAIPGSQEVIVPADLDPFKVAAAFRAIDPTAAYAVLDRADRWYVVAMPDDPPAQTSESESRSVTVWRTKVSVCAVAAPMLVAEFLLYGPTKVYLDAVCRRISNVAPMVLRARHDPVTAVGFGPDDDGVSAGWVDDGSNEMATVEAVGGIIKHVRRVYPRNVPDNTELAKQLAAVFADLNPMNEGVSRGEAS